MKKINTSNVTSTARQPLLGRSITHLSEGVSENDNSLFNGILNTLNIGYTTNDVIILHGCVLTGSYSGAGNAYSVTAGAVYYNGEIYQVDAVSGTISGTNVLIGSVSTTYQSGDPVQMSDGNLKNVHEINKIAITQAGTGTGIKDFSAWGTIKRPYSLTSSATQSTSSGTMVDVTGLTYTTPNDGLTRLWLILHKGYSTATGASSDGTGHEIYNNTAATQLDYTEAYQDEASATVDQRIPYICMWIGTLAANTTIKARFKSLSGSSLPIKENKLMCVAL